MVFLFVLIKTLICFAFYKLKEQKHTQWHSTELLTQTEGPHDRTSSVSWTFGKNAYSPVIEVNLLVVGSKISLKSQVKALILELFLRMSWFREECGVIMSVILFASQ